MNDEEKVVKRNELLLLDSTVWLAAVDSNDPHHNHSRMLLQTWNEFTALDLTFYEVANVATTKWKDPAAAGRLTAAIAVATETTLIRATPEIIQAATKIAEDHGLSVYDAAYAAAKELLQVRLISLDSDLLQPGYAITPEDLLSRDPHK